MKFYNLVSLQIVSKSDICVSRIDFIINLFKFKKKSLRLTNLFNIRKITMNKCLKILLLATTVLKYGEISASTNNEVMEVSPSPSNKALVVHVSPVAHDNGILQPAFNAFIVPRSTAFASRISALTASVGNVLQKRQEYSSALIMVNAGMSMLNDSHAGEEEAVEAVARYCDLVSDSEEIVLSVQGKIDSLNSKSGANNRKIIGFRRILESDKRYLEARNSDLRELDRQLSNGSVSSSDSVVKLLKDYGVMFADQQSVVDTGATNASVSSSKHHGADKEESVNSAHQSESGELGEDDI